MDAKLIMFKADGQRKEFPLTSATIVIGRGEECDLRVPLSSVSRRHCELQVADDSLTVKDLGSSNGTFVNNKRVAEQALNAGDRLVVGPVVFTVQVNGQPEGIKNVRAKPAPKGPAKQPAAAGSVQDEIIDLDADAGGDEQTLDQLIGAGGADDEDVDVISALEELTKDGDDDEPIDLGPADSVVPPTQPPPKKK